MSWTPTNTKCRNHPFFSFMGKVVHYLTSIVHIIRMCRQSRDGCRTIVPHEYEVVITSNTERGDNKNTKAKSWWFQSIYLFFSPIQNSVREQILRARASLPLRSSARVQLYKLLFWGASTKKPTTEYRLFGQNENFGTKTGHHVTRKRLRPTQWKFNGQCIEPLCTAH